MKKKRTSHGIAIAGALTLPVTAVLAQDWTEIGDSPAFPAGCGQPVTGDGAVSTIAGATATTDGDFVDSYLIDIVDPKGFYATTSSAMDPNAFANWNTRLFLFDSDGTPALANDDLPIGGSQSYIGNPGMWVGTVGPTVGALEPGRYILVISGWANDPLDESGSALFDLSIPMALVGPEPKTGPFAEWEDFHGLVQSGEYVIGIAGVQFITDVTAPCLADVNCDLVVDVDDLTGLILQWGGDDPAADIDGSGVVGVDDLVAVLLAWGRCP